MTNQKPTLNQADIDVLIKTFVTKDDLVNATLTVSKQLEQVDIHLDQVDKRLEQVDKRLEQVDQRFDLLEANIADTLAIPLQNHETRLQRVEKNLDLPPLSD